MKTKRLQHKPMKVAELANSSVKIMFKKKKKSCSIHVGGTHTLNMGRGEEPSTGYRMGSSLQGVVRDSSLHGRFGINRNDYTALHRTITKPSLEVAELTNSSVRMT